MKHIIVLLSLLSLASLTYAEPWRPYVGIAGVIDTRQKIGLSWDRPVVSLKPQYIGYGSQTDFGVEIGRHEIYFSYHFSESNDLEHWSGIGVELTDTTHVWASTNSKERYSEKRYSLGYRRVFGNPTRALVVPMIGAAAEVIEVKHSENSTYERKLILFWPYPPYRPSEERILESHAFSGTKRIAFAPGILFEFGIYVRLYAHISGALMTQFHYYYADWKPYGLANSTAGSAEYVLVHSSVAQLRYTFGREK